MTIRASRLSCRLIALSVFVKGALFLVGSGFAAVPPPTERSVVVLYSERGDQPEIEAVEENMRQVLRASTSPRIELFSEYLDFSRFPAEQYEQILVRYLQERYTGRQIDLVVPVTGLALEFALAHRELFPGAPLVFCAIDQRELEKVRLPADATGFTAHFDIGRTIDLILQLQPNVPEIVCVSGTSGFDQRWAEETRKIMERFHSRVPTRWITDKSLEETTEEVGRLPRDSAVFFVSMLRDGIGHSISSVDAVRDLARVSKAPIYGVSSLFLDAGAVGGAMFDFGANGRSTAELVLKTLRGQWVTYGAPETESHNQLLINWQALKRAGLPESRVPADAQVRLRPPGLWETHRTFILVVAGAIFLQAVLITGLVAERFWRRRAEASLRESEERFRAMANTAPVMIWMSGADKLCTFFNKGWLDFTGRPLEQELGNGWAEGVHREDIDGCLGVYVKSFDAHQHFSIEYRLRRSDDEYRWVLHNGTPRFAPNGTFIGYIGSAIDITERKQAEERFRLVVEASPNGIVLVNKQGRIELVNAYTENLFGYGREELIGQAIEILVPERFRALRPAHRAQFLAAPEAWMMGLGRELVGLRKDGSEFPIEIGLSRIQSQEGILVLTVIIDISARKQAQAEAQQYREELTHFGRVEILGEMATSLAHELNQPLTGIMNNASAARRFIAKGRADTTKLDGLFESVVADARRAGEIIRGIRGMARKGEQVPSSVNLNSIIAEVVRFIHSDALQRQCAIVMELDPKLPIIKANSVLLQQVLLNVIVNAFDAMRETPVVKRSVIIRTECEFGGAARVSVRDFGTGLPAENPERIFEHFFSTKHDGLGMGLAIVRSIIASHGGELTAMNADGGGACFYFSLPAVPEAAA